MDDLEGAQFHVIQAEDVSENSVLVVQLDSSWANIASDDIDEYERDLREYFGRYGMGCVIIMGAKLRIMRKAKGGDDA